MSAVAVIPAFNEETSLAEIAEIEGLVPVVADLREIRRLEPRTRRLGEEFALLNARLDDAERADDGEGES